MNPFYPPEPAKSFRLGKPDATGLVVAETVTYGPDARRGEPLVVDLGELEPAGSIVRVEQSPLPCGHPRACLGHEFTDLDEEEPDSPPVEVCRWCADLAAVVREAALLRDKQWEEAIGATLNRDVPTISGIPGIREPSK